MHWLGRNYSSVSSDLRLSEIYQGVPVCAAVTFIRYNNLHFELPASFDLSWLSSDKEVSIKKQACTIFYTPWIFVVNLFDTFGDCGVV